MSRIRSLQLAVLGVAFALGGPALAAPGAALVEVAVDGSWTAREQVQLHVAVSRALGAAGLLLVGPEQVEMALAGRSAASCRDDRCRIELGRALDVGRLVFAHLRAESGGVTVSFVLFNVEVGERTGSATRFARGDAPAVLHATMGQAAASLLRAELPMAAARLAVRTRPPGARIAVDGRPLGEGDAELPVTAGAHVVTLEKAGFVRAEVRVTVRANETAPVEVVLTPAPGDALAVGGPRPVVGPAPRGDGEVARPWRTAGLVVVAAGVAALATGIGLYAYGCTPTDGYARCPVKGSVRPAGAALMGVGGALAGIGVGLWIYDARRARARAARAGARVALGPTGARLTLGPTGAALSVVW